MNLCFLTLELEVSKSDKKQQQKRFQTLGTQLVVNLNPTNVILTTREDIVS